MYRYCELKQKGQTGKAVGKELIAAWYEVKTMKLR